MSKPALACRRFAATWLAALSLALPCAAESLGSSASSASSAGSASSGSLSDSVGGSSDSGAPKAQAAEGLFRVQRVAQVEGRPEMLQVHLVPAADAAAPAADALWLRLPREALAAGALAPGDLVRVQQRPWGQLFAYAGQRRDAFFLALRAAWQQDLQSLAL